mmetsp:Transcript_25479/g.55128  ORF Transcript_25479/g.55128 Transcript_25479/m.55128 type:complete len:128 (-) Transcript_25479:362-745(-)
MDPTEPIANGTDTADIDCWMCVESFLLGPFLSLAFSMSNPDISVSAKLAGNSFVQHTSYNAWEAGAKPRLDNNDATTNETRVPLPPPRSLNLSATVPASADTVKAATAEPVLLRDVVVIAVAEIPVE